jgi:flagellar M-ring protein FliF
MGKETLFGESRPAKASVVLKLKGQRQLSEPSVAGISNLVAASVEGLRPEAVVILDSFGRPLARPRDTDEGMAAHQLERQQRMESEMAARVVALLEPVVGQDRVRVNVAVKLNPQTLEQTEETFDPNAVVRSRQTQADQTTSGVPGAVGAAPGAAAGVAGARANTPQTAEEARAAMAQLGPGPSSTRNAETTQYEVSRTTRHLLQPAGEVARLSVAVILDDDQAAKTGEDGRTTIERTPRTPEQIQKIQGLVAAAVGLETERGDQLTVENVSFDEPVFVEEPPAPFYERYSPQLWQGSRILTVAVLGLLAFFMVVRPLMKRAVASSLPVPAPAGGAPLTAVPTTSRGPRTVSEMESEIDAQLDAVTAKYAEDRRLPVLTRRVSQVTVNEPESVAKLLRAWINDPER